MGNRCPSCEKMVGLETEVEDPDGSDWEYDPATGNVTGTVRVVRKCVDCSEEMKECTFDVDVHAEPDAKTKDGDEYAVEIDTYEATETGGGRYKKNMIGFELSGHVTRTRKGKETEVAKFDASDNTQASGFDDLN